jgi:hypothetical protein
MGSDLVVIFLRLMALDDAGAFRHRRGDGRNAGLGQRDHRGDRPAYRMDMAPYWQADDAFFELCATAKCSPP